MTDTVSQPQALLLRDYQLAAVDATRAKIMEGWRRVLLAAPTAFGKTECSMYVITQAMTKGARAWFIVDRKTLIKQTSDRFASYGIDHGIIQADHPLTDLSKAIQIASAQTLENRSFSSDQLPDLIIWDECHEVRAAVVRLIGQASKARVLGLSASPFTAGMAQNWDGVVNGATVNYLLERGFLTPLKIKACVTPDMTDAKRKFTGEYDEDDAGERGIVIIGDVVQTWVQQTQQFFGGPVKTIVFSPSVAHGEELCRQFADAGFNFQQISYLDKSDADRNAKIDEFRKPDSSIHGLVSCAILTKGFDVRDVLCGISCRPYRRSFSSHIQEMGRVMRISPETGKTFGLWLDHSGNCISFAEDTAWLYEHGVESLSDAEKQDSKVREAKPAAKAERFCGSCGMQMEVGSNICHACGWERPKRGEIQIVEGNLIDFEVNMHRGFQPRRGLRAACLEKPGTVWNAALAYCFAKGTKGSEGSRRWAYGVWSGIYPHSKLPRSLYNADCRADEVTTEAYDLIHREVVRFRRGRAA